MSARQQGPPSAKNNCAERNHEQGINRLHLEHLKGLERIEQHLVLMRVLGPLHDRRTSGQCVDRKQDRG